MLERQGESPAGLALSGCHAPHLRGRRLLSPLDDRTFLTQLVDIGGCSAELLAEPALMALFLPMLRADFRATERYHRPASSDRQRLRTPALLIHGSNDAEADHSEVAAWAQWLARGRRPGLHRRRPLLRHPAATGLPEPSGAPLRIPLLQA
ncbi:thioesterase domain-containing protein [Xanthomonas hortorum pv. pelargonii]|nr:thioesterase domain-containing protein [Xanthomonas hortorum pv. pelargonii]